MGRKETDISGKLFGELTAIKPFSYGRSPRWLFQCSCGNIKDIRKQNVIRGTTKTCNSSDHHNRLPENKSHLSTFNQVYLNYYNDGNITLEQFIELSQKNCFYCNKPPSNNYYRKYGKSIVYNGLDRVDNSKSHDLENVVPCCKQCNIAKSNYSKEEFLLWIKSVYNNLIKVI